MMFPPHVVVRKETQEITVKAYYLIFRILIFIIAGMFLFIGGLLVLVTRLFNPEQPLLPGNWAWIAPLIYVVFFGFAIWLAFALRIIITKDLTTNQLIIKRLASKEVIPLTADLRMVMREQSFPPVMWGKRYSLQSAQVTTPLTFYEPPLGNLIHVPLRDTDAQKIAEALQLPITQA